MTAYVLGVLTTPAVSLGLLWLLTRGERRQRAHAAARCPADPRELR